MKEGVIRNRWVRRAYTLLFYFNMSRTKLSTLYLPLVNITVLLLGVQGLLGIELTKPVMGLAVLVFFSLFAITGYIMKHVGLYDVYVDVAATKNVWQSEVVERLRAIEQRMEAHNVHQERVRCEKDCGFTHQRRKSS